MFTKNQITFATIGILSVCLWYDLTYSAENLPGCIEEMKLMTHQVNVVRKEAVTQPEKIPTMTPLSVKVTLLMSEMSETFVVHTYSF